VIVVSDTSPLNYLVQLDATELLRQLYGQVYVPHEVIAELQHPGAPAAVRAWASALPHWVEVRSPAGIDPALVANRKLDAGETAAIALAVELRAIVLIDEREATKAAEAMGLLATGTLGVLDTAAQRGLVQLRPLLDNLVTRTTFRCNKALVDRLIERDARRRGGDRTPPSGSTKQ
jgi:predicted nucleic acid-binding protein